VPAPRTALTLALLLFAASGANCPQALWQHPHLPPPALSASPTIDDVIAVVNRNTALVQTLASSQATISGSGFPTLRAHLALEKPRRLRLRATHALTGPEIDLGSNHELFWLWLRRSQPPAMYFCGHDQFAGSAMRRLIPVAPEQIVEAFGLVTLDPQSSHQGPESVPGGRLRIRSTVNGPEGPLTCVTIVDERMGWVLEQHLYDAANQHLATVKTSRHRQDARSGAYLPQTIEMYWPVATLSFTIDIDRYQVNEPVAPELWVKPEEPGFPNVNLADPAFAGAIGPQNSDRPQPPDRSAAARPSWYNR
jgi:hypothetical protein